MASRVLRRWVIGGMMGMVVTCGHAAEEGAKIPAGALEGWKRFDHLRENVTFDGIQAEKFLNGDMTKSHLNVSVRWPCACMEQRFIDPKTDKETGKIWVLCRGPKCSFFLEKKANSPYVVKAIVRTRQEEPFSYFIYLDNFLCRVSEVPYRAGGKIVENAQKPGFAVQSVRTEETAGRTLVVVDCRYEIQPGMVRSGWFRLDPALDWAVVQHEFVDQTSGKPDASVATHRGANEYRNQDGVTIPVRTMESTTLYSPSRPKSKGSSDGTERQAKEVRFGPLGDDVFSLTRFGVSDILYEPPPRSRFKSREVGLMGGCLGVAVAATIALIARSRRTSVPHQNVET